MDGKTALGASSPAKPAFTRPEPLSHTRAVVSSSSHMLTYSVEEEEEEEETGAVKSSHDEEPTAPSGSLTARFFLCVIVSFFGTYL